MREISDLDSLLEFIHSDRPRKMKSPFWRYYGGKFRAAPRYPKPKYQTIIEPFAGSAGYSMRYPDRDIILVEKYKVIADIWRFLIESKPSGILSIPCVERVVDLPEGLHPGAYSLVGFCFNDATVAPSRVLSAGRKKLATMNRKFEGWNENRRELVSWQSSLIKHWQIIEGDYTSAPSIPATYFIDPPYNNRVGSHYVHSELDYLALGEWSASRNGQVIVCENEGADWLPFEPFGTFKAGVNGKGSKEVIWEYST